MSTLKSDSIQPVTNSNNLIFKTGAGDLERMRIQPNGKFVINNTRADVGAGSGLTGQNALGTIHLVQNTTNDNWVGMTTSATTAATTSQGGILIQGSHIYGTKIHFLTTDVYNDGQKNRMTLDHLGRLGIGTTTPGASLDVNGTLKVSGQITHGSAPIAVPSGTAPIFGVRAWVRFTRHSNGTITIQGQGNVSSVTSDVGGVYTITFTTALPENYAIAGVANEANPSGTGGGGGLYQSAVNLFSNADCTTTSCKITFANIDSNGNVHPEVCSLIFVG